MFEVTANATGPSNWTHTSHAHSSRIGTIRGMQYTICVGVALFLNLLEKVQITAQERLAAEQGWINHSKNSCKSTSKYNGCIFTIPVFQHRSPIVPGPLPYNRPRSRLRGHIHIAKKMFATIQYNAIIVRRHIATQPLSRLRRARRSI
jgi:hypothetical protein